MLEVGKPTAVAQRFPVFPRIKADKLDAARAEPAPAAKINSRDAFVADVAIKLDHVQTEIKRLGRQVDLMMSDVAELREEQDRTNRFASFQEKEQRLKTLRIEDVQRRLQDVKQRLDAFDPKGNGDYTAYPSLQAVSRRLTDLSVIERDFRMVERKLKLSAGLFCGSLLVWLATLLAT